MPVDWLRDGERRSTSTITTTTRVSATSTWSTSSASCTAEIVYELGGLLGADVTPRSPSALYVGLVTDTGKFMYENTDAGTHRVAAELIEAGVDVDDTFRRLYEHVPLEKLRLIARALEGSSATRRPPVITYISADDYEATGADEEMTEGIIDYLRGVEGTRWRRWSATRAPAARRPQGQPALHRRRGRRLGDRPQAGRRRAQARRRLLDRPRARRAGRVPQRRGPRPALA